MDSGVYGKRAATLFITKFIHKKQKARLYKRAFKITVTNTIGIILYHHQQNHYRHHLNYLMNAVFHIMYEILA